MKSFCIIKIDKEKPSYHRHFVFCSYMHSNFSYPALPKLIVLYSNLLYNIYFYGPARLLARGPKIVEPEGWPGSSRALSVLARLEPGKSGSRPHLCLSQLQGKRRACACLLFGNAGGGKKGRSFMEWRENKPI